MRLLFGRNPEKTLNDEAPTLKLKPEAAKFGRFGSTASLKLECLKLQGLKQFDRPFGRGENQLKNKGTLFYNFEALLLLILR